MGDEAALPTPSRADGMDTDPPGADEHSSRVKHTDFVHHSTGTMDAPAETHAATMRYEQTHHQGYNAQTVDKHTLMTDSYASMAAVGARRPGAHHGIATEMKAAPTTHAAELRKHISHHEGTVAGADPRHRRARADNTTRVCSSTRFLPDIGWPILLTDEHVPHFRQHESDLAHAPDPLSLPHKVAQKNDHRWAMNRRIMDVGSDDGWSGSEVSFAAAPDRRYGRE